MSIDNTAHLSFNTLSVKRSSAHAGALDKDKDRDYNKTTSGECFRSSAVPPGTPEKPARKERVFHSITAGFFALWLTLGAACSTLLADQMRRPRYSVVLRTPYESRRERQSKRGRQLLLLLWRFKRPNLAAKFATNRNVSLDKSKSFLQSVTHVAAGSAACSARRFRRSRRYVKGLPLDQTVCSFFMFFVRRTSRRHSVFGVIRK